MSLNTDSFLRWKSPSRPCPTASCSRTPGNPGPSTTVISPARSEERRVGKECRYRWSPDHKKKKDGLDVEQAAGNVEKTIDLSVSGAEPVTYLFSIIIASVVTQVLVSLWTVSTVL